MLVQTVLFCLLSAGQGVDRAGRRALLCVSAVVQVSRLSICALAAHVALAGTYLGGQRGARV
jgi:hypothetical protein